MNESSRFSSSSSGSQEGLNAVFEKFSSIIDSKFEEFGRQLLEQSSSKVEEAVKKVKRDSYVCKRKGNQQQFDHSLDVLEKLEEAGDLIVSNSLESAKKKKSPRESSWFRSALKLLNSPIRVNMDGRPLTSTCRTS